MKPILKIRADEYEADHFPSAKKDWSIGLKKPVPIIVIFMAGIILGLSFSSHFTRYFSVHTDIYFPESMYSSDCHGIENLLKPSHLMHKMSDDELFWRASMVAKKLEFPLERVPRVAFMFMTRGPLPFSPLWDMFFKGHDELLYSVYVHSLPDYKLNVTEDSAFFGRQIPSEEVEWGTISLVDAEKRLLANALLDFSNERFILLSESCIPLFNFQIVYNYLINSEYTFVHSFDEDSPRGRGRYNTYMSPSIELDQWRKGSEWFELNRELAINVIADTKYYSLFTKYCTPSCYPDEHYIPTYLNMFYGHMNSNRSVTWVDWSRGGSHPAMFGEESVDERFVQSIRSNGTACTYNGKPTSVCYLFARKFAPSALKPLMDLSSSVMEF